MASYEIESRLRPPSSTGREEIEIRRDLHENHLDSFSTTGCVKDVTEDEEETVRV
jgi:hypothetical protein